MGNTGKPAIRPSAAKRRALNPFRIKNKLSKTTTKLMTSTGALERAKAAFIVTSATRAVLAFDVHWALTFSL